MVKKNKESKRSKSNGAGGDAGGNRAKAMMGMKAIMATTGKGVRNKWYLSIAY